MISKSRTDKENYFPQVMVNQKVTSSVSVTRSWHETLENELWESLNKLDHRAEILIAISHNQRASGSYESAEAYRKQAMKSKAHAQSIRKLLMSLA